MEQLREGILAVVRRIRGAEYLDEREVESIIRELQRVLLKADVDVKLVFELSEKLRKRFQSEELPPGFSKRELLLKLLYEELVNILGGQEKVVIKPAKPPYTILLVGVEGSGKTTTAAKLAHYFQSRGYKVGLVSADTYRPAAYEQLEQLARKVGCLFYGEPSGNALGIARRGLEHLKRAGAQVIIVDTAGRHKDEVGLMEEVELLAKEIKPDTVVMVVDATQGKAVARQAQAFRERVPLGYIIVSKMDGSAKGGGALSAVAATGARVAFIGVGEKIEDLEEFDPKSFVARLLGMPDLESLLRRFAAYEAMQRERLKALSAGKITLLDLKEQLIEARKMGPLGKLLEMVGLGVPSKELVEKGEENVEKWIAILNSMTMEELLHPEIIDRSRISRIARGSGTTPRDVKMLLESFERARKLLRQAARSRRGGLPGLRL
uniref:Signal recognition particle 54 kDa protein n=1 Tax=Thermofilum pendens TaxID=2269 RepID=A0A7C4B9H8_THEPE